MKKYILKRDLPTFKAGETFVLLDSFETHGLYRESDGIMAYHQTTLYKFPNILMEWFEEIKPAEPLIKDEKVRKAVRAWAEVNGVDRIILGQVNNDELVKKSPTTAFGCHISFEGSLGLERGRNYTLPELCGEEKE